MKTRASFLVSLALAFLTRSAAANDDGVWSLLLDVASGMDRMYRSTFYDPVGDRLLIFGGQSCIDPYLYASGIRQFAFAGSGVFPQSAPAALADAIALQDPVNDRMIIFGGHQMVPNGNFHSVFYSNETYFADMSGPNAWAWYVPNPLGTPPAPRSKHTAIFDPARQRMIVFGGSDDSNVFGDVWELVLGSDPAWNPTWHQLAPAGLPGTRTGHFAILDPVRDRMIVYGAGIDLWALSLSEPMAWTQLVTSGEPPTGITGAVYDPARDRMLVYRTVTTPNAAPIGEVYALSLSGPLQWTRLTPAGEGPGRPGPPIVAWAAIGFDTARDRLLVAGQFCSRFFPAGGLWALTFSAPVAVQVSLAMADASPREVRLAWMVSGAPSTPPTLERRRDPESGWTRLGELRADGSERLSYVDRDVLPGARYGYRLRLAGPDGEHVAGETWVTVPARAQLALESPRPNPGRADAEIEFSLPDDRPARLEVFDESGRGRAARTVSGAGSHVVPFSGLVQAPAPGLYLLRLSAHGRAVVRKLLVTR